MSREQIRQRLETTRTCIGEGPQPRWRLFGLVLKGGWLDDGVRLCPRTAAALREVPRLVNAGFSCLEAGYRLAPHQGYDRRMLRAHLGLIVPDGDCALRVDGEARLWECGRAQIFDDMHLHEAWSLTGENRFVLIVDVQREPGRIPQEHRSP